MIFSVDFEEWYNLLGYGEDFNKDWDSYEGFIPDITDELLDWLDELGIVGLFFVLGYVAEKYPNQIRKIAQRGHMIGSHGYNHDLVFDLSRAEFYADVERSLTILKEVVGYRPFWFRAPGFSVNEQTPWFYEVLAELGIRYDSSLSQVNRGYGGNLVNSERKSNNWLFNGKTNERLNITASTGVITVIPVATDTFKKVLFGGGYFRILPLFILRQLFNDKQDTETFFYIHPRDLFISNKENLSISLLHSLRSNYGRSNSKNKLKKLMQNMFLMSPWDIDNSNNEL